MARYSVSDRSRSPPRLRFETDRGITVDIGRRAADALKDDKIIFGRLKDLFKAVHIEPKDTEITFYGSAGYLADSMMNLFRYLQIKNITCTR